MKDHHAFIFILVILMLSVGALVGWSQDGALVKEMGGRLALVWKLALSCALLIGIAATISAIGYILVSSLIK